MPPQDILYANYAEGYKVWNLGHVFNIDDEQIFVEIYFETVKSISKIFVGFVSVGAVGAITPTGSELSPIDV